MGEFNTGLFLDSLSSTLNASSELINTISSGEQAKKNIELQQKKLSYDNDQLDYQIKMMQMKIQSAKDKLVTDKCDNYINNSFFVPKESGGTGFMENLLLNQEYADPDKFREAVINQRDSVINAQNLATQTGVSLEEAERYLQLNGDKINMSLDNKTNAYIFTAQSNKITTGYSAMATKTAYDVSKKSPKEVIDSINQIYGEYGMDIFDISGSKSMSNPEFASSVMNTWCFSNAKLTIDATSFVPGTTHTSLVASAMSSYKKDMEESALYLFNGDNEKTARFMASFVANEDSIREDLDKYVTSIESQELQKAYDKASAADEYYQQQMLEYNPINIQVYTQKLFEGLGSDYANNRFLKQVYNNKIYSANEYNAKYIDGSYTGGYDHSLLLSEMGISNNAPASFVYAAQNREYSYEQTQGARLNKSLSDAISPFTAEYKKALSYGNFVNMDDFSSRINDSMSSFAESPQKSMMISESIIGAQSVTSKYIDLNYDGKMDPDEYLKSIGASNNTYLKAQVYSIHEEAKELDANEAEALRKERISSASSNASNTITEAYNNRTAINSEGVLAKAREELAGIKGTNEYDAAMNSIQKSILDYQVYYASYVYDGSKSVDSILSEFGYSSPENVDKVFMDALKAKATSYGASQYESAKPKITNYIADTTVNSSAKSDTDGGTPVEQTADITGDLYTDVSDNSDSLYVLVFDDDSRSYEQITIDEYREKYGAELSAVGLMNGVLDVSPADANHSSYLNGNQILSAAKEAGIDVNNYDAMKGFSASLTSDAEKNNAEIRKAREEELKGLGGEYGEQLYSIIQNPNVSLQDILKKVTFMKTHNQWTPQLDTLFPQWCDYDGSKRNDGVMSTVGALGQFYKSDIAVYLSDDMKKYINNSMSQKGGMNVFLDRFVRARPGMTITELKDEFRDICNYLTSAKTSDELKQAINANMSYIRGKSEQLPIDDMSSSNLLRMYRNGELSAFTKPEIVATYVTNLTGDNPMSNNELLDSITNAITDGNFTSYNELKKDKNMSYMANNVLLYATVASYEASQQKIAQKAIDAINGVTGSTGGMTVHIDGYGLGIMNNDGYLAVDGGYGPVHIVKFSKASQQYKDIMAGNNPVLPMDDVMGNPNRYTYDLEMAASNMRANSFERYNIITTYGVDPNVKNPEMPKEYKDIVEYMKDDPEFRNLIYSRYIAFDNSEMI